MHVRRDIGDVPEQHLHAVFRAPAEKSFSGSSAGEEPLLSVL